MPASRDRQQMECNPGDECATRDLTRSEFSDLKQGGKAEVRVVVLVPPFFLQWKDTSDRRKMEIDDDVRQWGIGER
ncbi:hypothetical protein NL676_039581 [Syzygium grande]|nr:hypothetical protein NL676_039581 [Syzygium grande]